MTVKPPKTTVTVEIHTPPRLPEPPQVRPDHGLHSDLPRMPLPPRQPENVARAADLDAITAAPILTVSELSSPIAVPAPAQRPLKDYRVTSTHQIPAPDSEGLRTAKGRLFVDVPGGIVHAGLDPRSGLFRAKLPTESSASGPVLLQDPQSKRWFALDDDTPPTLPLSASRLEPFRAAIDLYGARLDADNLYRLDGKLYAIIEHHAFQVMRDADASSPERQVWRIVNAKDPVAHDADNVYHASRSGETLTITRGARGLWLSVIVGLVGGMRRHPSTTEGVTLLLQRYEPIRKACEDLIQSTVRFNQLRDQSYKIAEEGPERTAALVALEVHVRKHIRMQADFVAMYIEHKEWLVYLKAGGIYKKELFEQQMLRVDYMDKLMATMDLRAAPMIASNTLESSKHKLALLDKKLLVLQDRQIVIDQIKKGFRDADHDLEMLSGDVPDAEKIRIHKYHCYLHLLTGDLDSLPSVGLYTVRAMRAIEDMRNAKGPGNPLALRLFLEQINMEKNRFEILLASEPAEKAQYIKKIIPLLESFEARIEKQLADIYQTLESNTQLPEYGHDIDFDFLPEQPKDSPPVAPRKVFRTREQGSYKVLVGETETASDGSVTVKVPDPYKPHMPAQRYEKHQGEWRPITIGRVTPDKGQLISDANQSLSQVDEHLRMAQIQEQQKANPTNIVELLAARADRLEQLARGLSETNAASDDAHVAQLIERLASASERLSREGQNTLTRMYKNREVLDILRLNYLLDHAELSARRTVERKPQGKGQSKSFLDVYVIKDRATDTPLWEAHFHYDKKDSPALGFAVRGGHLKTLEQSGRGLGSQRRDENAGLPHVAIWRETFDGRTARKIFELTA